MRTLPTAPGVASLVMLAALALAPPLAPAQEDSDYRDLDYRMELKRCLHAAQDRTARSKCIWRYMMERGHRGR